MSYKLINEIQEGSETAFKKLVEDTKDMVVNTCYGFLQNKEEAEDIAQEVFIEVFKSIGEFKGEAKLSTWLYKIAVNKSLNQIKKNKWKNLIQNMGTYFSSNENPGINKIEDKNASPQEVIENNEREKSLNKAINTLPENQKTAFILCKYEGLSYKQISDVMDTSLSSVESLMYRAKKIFKKNYTTIIKRSFNKIRKKLRHKFL